MSDLEMKRRRGSGVGKWVLLVLAALLMGVLFFFLPQEEDDDDEAKTPTEVVNVETNAPDENPVGFLRDLVQRPEPKTNRVEPLVDDEAILRKVSRQLGAGETGQAIETMEGLLLDHPRNIVFRTQLAFLHEQAGNKQKAALSWLDVYSLAKHRENKDAIQERITRLQRGQIVSPDAGLVGLLADIRPLEPMDPAAAATSATSVAAATTASPTNTTASVAPVTVARVEPPVSPVEIPDPVSVDTSVPAPDINTDTTSVVAINVPATLTPPALTTLPPTTLTPTQRIDVAAIASESISNQVASATTTAKATTAKTATTAPTAEGDPEPKIPSRPVLVRVIANVEKEMPGNERFEEIRLVALSLKVDESIDPRDLSCTFRFVDHKTDKPNTLVPAHGYTPQLKRVGANGEIRIITALFMPRGNRAEGCGYFGYKAQVDVRDRFEADVNEPYGLWDVPLDFQTEYPLADSILRLSSMIGKPEQVEPDWFENLEQTMPALIAKLPKLPAPPAVQTGPDPSAIVQAPMPTPGNPEEPASGAAEIASSDPVVDTTVPPATGTAPADATASATTSAITNPDTGIPATSTTSANPAVTSANPAVTSTTPATSAATATSATPATAATPETSTTPPADTALTAVPDVNPAEPAATDPGDQPPLTDGTEDAAVTAGPNTSPRPDAPDPDPGADATATISVPATVPATPLDTTAATEPTPAPPSSAATEPSASGTVSALDNPSSNPPNEASTFPAASSTTSTKPIATTRNITELPMAASFPKGTPPPAAARVAASLPSATPMLPASSGTKPTPRPYPGVSGSSPPTDLAESQPRVASRPPTQPSPPPRNRPAPGSSASPAPVGSSTAPSVAAGPGVGPVSAFQVGGGRDRTLQIPIQTTAKLTESQLLVKAQFFEREQDRPQVVYISEVVPRINIARTGGKISLLLSYSVPESQKATERERYGKELAYLGYAVQVWYQGRMRGEFIDPEGLVVKPEMLRPIPLPRRPVIR